MTVPAKSTPEAFWANVDRTAGPSGCWPWRLRIHSGGYGQVRYQGSMKKAHRLAYELAVGDIPDGLEIDHLCRNRACCNPAHLEAVSHATNVRRAFALKTTCPEGHALEGANVIRDSPSGARRCRTCRAAQNRARKERARRAAGAKVGARGENNARAKLTEGAVRAIRGSSARAADLAQRFGVSRSMISAIRTGKNWTHLAN